MYIVKCRNASGQTREIRVTDVRNGERAARVALRFLHRIAPGAGWVAEWVL